MFEISKTRLPIPSAKAGGMTLYPLRMMEIGEHFDAPNDMGETKVGSSKRASAISSAARHVANRGKKFVTRKEGDIIRCWREA